MIGHAKTLNRVQAAQIMFFINAAIWMVFGVFSLTTMIASDAVPAIAAWFIAILMWGNAGAMLIAGAGIGRRRRLFYYFGIALLAANILLTFTDQFGAADLITLVIDVFLLGLLISLRSRFILQAR